MKGDEHEGKIVGELEKSRSSTIRVTAKEFKGHAYVDIREFVTSADYSGPTRKGVTVRPDLVPALVALLEKAAEHTAAGGPEGGLGE